MVSSWLYKRGEVWVYFEVLFLSSKTFSSKILSSESQKVKTNQNHTFTKHEVIWSILKSTKICDLGMEKWFFVKSLLIYFLRDQVFE